MKGRGEAVAKAGKKGETMTVRLNRMPRMLGVLAAGILSLLPLTAVCGDAVGEKGKWVRLAPTTPGQPDATDVNKVLPTGYPTAVRGVLAVDRNTGDLLVAACYYGLWKSADHGKTFVRIDNNKIYGGSPHSRYALQIDPDDGKKIAVFNANANAIRAFVVSNPDPAACGLTTDGGTTWHTFAPVKSEFHPDPKDLIFNSVCAVDWRSLTILATDRPYYSSDAGKSWQTLSRPSPNNGLGVFDAKVLVASKANIERSEDAGKTWTKVSDFSGVGPVQFFNGTAYWLSNKGIITSKDAGKTWTPLAATPAKVTHGPYFGKDEKHLVVLGADGFSETTDGGQTWKVVATNAPTHADVIPNGYGSASVDTSTAGFDPVNNTLYYLPTDGYLEDIWKFER
jgi:photosystem II stability/assembly factor-like uncharacterized protein